MLVRWPAAVPATTDFLAVLMSRFFGIVLLWCCWLRCFASVALVCAVLCWCPAALCWFDVIAYILLWCFIMFLWCYIVLLWCWNVLLVCRVVLLCMDLGLPWWWRHSLELLAEDRIWQRLGEWAVPATGSLPVERHKLTRTHHVTRCEKKERKKLKTEFEEGGGVKWTREVQIRMEEIPPSGRSLHGYIPHFCRLSVKVQALTALFLNRGNLISASASPMCVGNKTLNMQIMGEEEELVIWLNRSVNQKKTTE